jgi:ABC-type bacteriocin/lantibiotic exporter with double-glycine peptidase domain
MTTVKVCVVGLSGAGKTTLCKLLAGRAVEQQSSVYEPTEGVRIEELERVSYS